MILVLMTLITFFPVRRPLMTFRSFRAVNVQKAFSPMIPRLFRHTVMVPLFSTDREVRRQ